ncbi:hypothetical protein [Paenibacillus tepidiphilus]|uniref:hypothetical protein n=1 Tax=Paenibacillus tepidiphilus TaxID=2608683 RepID=UPI0012391A65|nr:hypothetical protein [Paenibacillus tepidiphilus]
MASRSFIFRHSLNAAEGWDTMLSEHMRETADIIAGYTVGRLVVDLAAGSVSLQHDDGSLLLLRDQHHIEIRNGDQYQHLTADQALAAVTAEGWPGYAGLYCRVRLNSEDLQAGKHA